MLGGVLEGLLGAGGPRRLLRVRAYKTQSQIQVSTDGGGLRLPPGC